MTIASISLGEYRTDIPPPSNLTFAKGSGSVSVPGGISGRYTRNTASQNVALKGLDLCVDAYIDGICVDLHSVRNWTISNNTIGPMCCGVGAGDVVGIRVAITAGQPKNSDVTIRGNLIRGILRYCNYWPSSVHGPCPGKTASAVHVDGIQMWGTSNVTIDRNRLYNVSVQGIFVSSAAGIGSNDKLTITNNLIGLSPDTSERAIELKLDTSSSLTGRNTIAFNTTPDRIELDGLATQTGNPSVDIVGNVAQVYTASSPPDGPGYCFRGVSGVTLTYRYNVETGSVGPCGSTDVRRGVPLANTSLLPATTMDLHLGGARGSTVADNLVPPATCAAYASRDVDGAVRPADTNCDAGGDERGGAPTAVVATSVVVRVVGDTVVVRWRVEPGRPAIGFNVFGERGGVRAKLNRALIRAHRGRGAYVFRARLGGRRYRAYWLQVLRADASNRWFRARTARS